jgi:hypothetical protein
MSGDTANNEYNKGLQATYARNTKPVTITLTAIEVFAVVSVIQASEKTNPALTSLGRCAEEAARKMHGCLEADSQLSLHLTEAWNGVKKDG